MATDLFKQYFSNPSKQYVFADMNCPGATSGDGAVFNIDDSAATIMNGSDTTASLDLSDLNVGLESQTNQTVTLQPNSITSLRGLSMGESQMTRCFGYISDNIIETEEWKYFCKVKFTVKFRYKGKVCIYPITVCAEFPTDIEEAVQQALNSFNIPINVYFVDNYIMFIGQNEGFEFYIDGINIALDDESFEADYKDNDNDFQDVLYEIPEMYVPAIKYKNGAFRGIIVRPIYPMYNDASISADMRSVKIAYVKDRVYQYEDLIAETKNICYRNLVDVDIDYRSVKEYEGMQWRFPVDFDCEHCFDKDPDTKWVDPDHRTNKKHHHDIWIEPDHQVRLTPHDDEWIEAVNNTNSLPDRITVHVNPHENVKRIMGLYGYATYVDENNLWIPVGSVFMDIAAPDGINTRNLIPSAILYNPNDYPIQANIMTFV